MLLPPPDILDSLTTELSQQLKDHVHKVLLDIVRPNSASQFAQNAPELAKFREAGSKEDVEFLRNFRELVPITTYESYKPFVAKFFATPCSEVDVKDIFAPGLPCFLAISSATSGSEPKYFARYRPPSQYLQHPIYLAASPSGGTMLAPSSLRYSEVLKIDREDSQSSQELVVCSVSSGFVRMQMNWEVEHDLNRLDLWVPGQTAPYALALVEGYRPFFILHALFALADPKVTIICFLFASVFVNLLQFIDDEWLLLVDCIESGVIPDLEGIDHVRGALEKHFTANPARAAELRGIGPPHGTGGWAVHVWPALKKFVGITGGSSAASVPKVTRVLGPSVTIQDRGYGSSECGIALPYQNGDPTVDLKVTMVNGLIEFVNVQSNERPDSQRVLSAWELVKDQLYQPILTTRDGLWRYRLGDVVAFKGFAPDDGMPVINYLHRKDGALGSSFGIMCTESELTNAVISAAERCIGQITEFTTVRDERETPTTFGFLLEVEGDIRENADTARQVVFETLMTSNIECRIGFWQGRLREPTIRLVERGTFVEFRKWKCDKAGISMGQVKVPVVVSDELSKEWFLKRVNMEL